MCDGNAVVVVVNKDVRKLPRDYLRCKARHDRAGCSDMATVGA